MISGEEERLLNALAVEEAEGEVPIVVGEPLTRRHERLQHRNRATIDNFLGKGNRANAIAILPRYYGELLTWALQRYIEKKQWIVVRTLNYQAPEPVYIDVSTDYDKRENLLINGQLLIEKDNQHLIVTVDINLKWRNSVRVEGHARMKEEIEKFVSEVKSIADEQNIYRNKRIEFGERIRFLNLHPRSWDSIIVNPGIKREIRNNTVCFLYKKALWSKHKIPVKRGILLAGEPGTGKTVACKALMAEAEGITCITTSAYGLSADEYITELYEMAQDLSPCIVFIEDIDLIGQNREEYSYQSGPALLALLAVLDGVEEKQEIVTVATTNNLETLDKAIKHRPSRFDRVIKLSPPSLEERRKLISLLCQEIPVDESIQDYIARKSEHCTPAQLQEIIYSLAIEHSDELLEPQSTRMEVSKDDIDTIVSKINGSNKHQIGFIIQDNHNGEKMNLIATTKLNQTPETSTEDQE